MRAAYSSKWKSSVQPRKQRKYVHNAPYHIKGAFLSIHLSKELRQKHGTRSIRVRSGDTVKIVRGTHKGKQGKVEKVDVTNSRIHIAKVESKKLQGGTASYPMRPSNCILVELAKDRKRFKRSSAKETKAPEIKENKESSETTSTTKKSETATKKD